MPPEAREAIRRLGKTNERAVDLMMAAGGESEILGIATALGAKRPRDLRRRVLSRLEAAGVVAANIRAMRKGRGCYYAPAPSLRPERSAYDEPRRSPPDVMPIDG